MSAALQRSLSLALGDDDDDDEDEVDEEMMERWEEACTCTDPSQGSVLGVRVDVRNRLMDRGHGFDDRFFWLGEDALYVSTATDPNPVQQPLRRSITELACDHNLSAEERHWHHGGLVNQPKFLQTGVDEQSQLEQGGGDNLNKPLLNGSSGSQLAEEVPPVTDLNGFMKAPWEIIPLEDILYCEKTAGQQLIQIHVHRHDDDLGRLITLEVGGKRQDVLDSWVESLRRRLLGQRRKTVDAPPPPSMRALLMEWVRWLQFPVQFFVHRTIPNMDDPKQQHLYPVAFTMSMVWLAIFAFTVIKACDGIHADFGISTTILGFTVAAAGTSFPNVFSGMCVARQGKTSMAIANALGANVQNVFLALAVPWTIQSFFINHGPFPMPVDMLALAVSECMITLLPVVLIYVCSSFSMPRWAGGLYLIVYVVYVVFALGQQTSHCWMWPMSCVVA